MYSSSCDVDLLNISPRDYEFLFVVVVWEISLRTIVEMCVFSGPRDHCFWRESLD